jgi:hypothetical protein
MLNRIKESIKGTNFYLALLLFAGSWFALPEDLGTSLYTYLAGFIGVFGALRLWAKNEFHFVGKDNLKKNANMWNYLGQIVLIVLPEATELIPALADLTEAIINKDSSVIVSRAMTFVVVVFYLIKPKTNA